MLLHPPEVWSASGAPGTAAAVDASRAAWGLAAATASVSSVAYGQHAKVSYRDVVNSSWQNKRSGAGGAQASALSLTATESHLRWSRSSMYAAAAASSGGADDAPASIGGGGGDGLPPHEARRLWGSDADVAALWPRSSPRGAALLAVAASEQRRQDRTLRSLIAAAARTAHSAVLRALVCVAAAALIDTPEPGDPTLIASLLPAALREAIAAGASCSTSRGLTVYLPSAGDADGPRAALRSSWAAGRVYAAGLHVRPLDIAGEAIGESTRWPGPGSVLAKAAAAAAVTELKSAGAAARLAAAAAATAANADGEEAAPAPAAASSVVVCGSHRAGEPGFLAARPAAALSALAASERALSEALFLCAYAWAQSVAHRAARSTPPLPPPVAELLDRVAAVGVHRLSAAVLSRVLLSVALAAAASGVGGGGGSSSSLDPTCGLGPGAVAVRLAQLAAAGLLVSHPAAADRGGPSTSSFTAAPAVATRVDEALRQAAHAGTPSEAALCAAVHGALLGCALPGGGRDATLPPPAELSHFLPLRLAKPWRLQQQGSTAASSRP